MYISVAHVYRVARRGSGYFSQLLALYHRVGTKTLRAVLNALNM